MRMGSIPKGAILRGSASSFARTTVAAGGSELGGFQEGRPEGWLEVPTGHAGGMQVIRG